MKLKKGSNGKYGYVDSKTGEWLIAPMYLKVTEFSRSGIAIVKLSEGRKIIINKENKNVTGKIYSMIRIQKNGYMSANEIDIKNPEGEKTKVFLKPTGEEIVELRGAFVVEITNSGTIEFLYKDRYGVYNLNSGKIISAKYDRIFNFRDDKGTTNYATVYKNRKAGLIDWDENIIIPFEYDDVILYERFGIVVAKKNEKIGVIDLKGKEIYPFEFSSYSITDTELTLNKVISTKIVLKEE